ncbi:MAG: hypothetical protein L6R43_11220 [Planctomycetes bacterium]|nr:hypothetical protein [Planctomycetota bacterium]
MILARVLEFLPLALVLGTTLAALRHGRMEEIQRKALSNFGRILLWLVLGCGALQVLLLLVQD